MPEKVERIQDQVLIAMNKYLEFYSSRMNREKKSLFFYTNLARLLYFMALIAGLAATFHIEKWLFRNDADLELMIPFTAAFCTGSGYIVSKYVESRGYLRAWIRFSLANAKITAIRDLFLIERNKFKEPLVEDDIDTCINRLRAACDVMLEETETFATEALSDFTNLIRLFQKYEAGSALPSEKLGGNHGRYS